MDVGSASSSVSSPSTQGQAQLGLLKKANDQQADQARQLLEAQQAEQARAQQQQQQAQQAAAATGRPGSVINTYA